MTRETQSEIYMREYWTGDSRDGLITNGDGYHYLRMQENGAILEALEFYERDDGEEIVTPLPDMSEVNWITDLGFEDFEALEKISQADFDRIKQLTLSSNSSDQL
ncbi:MAG: hypothetical protein OXT67_06570 [Zetaproteobacteria bacterium]|nr:hypothetical protein [Zetaproteobacteria bacterium]